MKKVISVLCALAVLSAGAFAQGPQGPQGPRRGGDNGWRERVRAEKVAFLTEEIDLTESEAQVFWPIYNEIQKTSPKARPRSSGPSTTKSRSRSATPSRK